MILGIPAVCGATEPLSDTLVVDQHSGPFHPQKCCWVELPRTEKLIAAKRAERCSAIGGPVGRFRLADDKIWLVGLRRCGADMPLSEIYPELANPAVATWLSGVFFVGLDQICVGPQRKRQYRIFLRLEIEKGVVTKMQREERDEAICESAP